MINTFANHFAKLVLGVPTGGAKHKFGPWIACSMPSWGLTKLAKVLVTSVNKVLQLCFKEKFVIFVSLTFTLSGCPLNVNLNLSTDKPISLYVVVDKPIEVKLAADIAVTKLPPIKADANIAVTKLPPIQADANIAVTKLPPIQADAKIGFTSRPPPIKTDP